jgi:2-methylisocitrate lyase-like PEP mutase family enzyme
MGLAVLLEKLRKVGYKRTIQGLYHVRQRMGNIYSIPRKCLTEDLQEKGK